ncbi:MAG: LptF/LptG family permease [Bacteroidota bacterium]
MKHLDRYIIQKYLVTFVYSIVVITVVAIVMDVSERIAKLIDSGLSFGEITTQYYLHFIPWINGELWPLFAFLSVIFFTSRLARDSEVIAMLGTGMSYLRILRPMIISAALVAGLHWIGENYVVPLSTYHLNEFKAKHISRSSRPVTTSNMQFFIDDHQKIYAHRFERRDSTINIFRLEEFDESGRLVKLFKAKKLIWMGYPNNWRAKDYEMRTFDDLEEDITYGISRQVDTVIAIVPGDFVRHGKQMEIMTSPDLKQYIAREKAKGLDNTSTYQIELFKRTAAPFTILILTLIGAAIGTRKVRGGLGMHLAAGVTLGAIFTLVSKFSETFANNLSFAPLLGVWLPNLIFGVLSWYLIRRAQQ